MGKSVFSSLLVGEQSISSTISRAQPRDAAGMAPSSTPSPPTVSSRVPPQGPGRGISGAAVYGPGKGVLAKYKYTFHICIYIICVYICVQIHIYIYVYIHMYIIGTQVSSCSVYTYVCTICHVACISFNMRKNYISLLSAYHICCTINHVSRAIYHKPYITYYMSRRIPRSGSVELLLQVRLMGPSFNPLTRTL